MQNETKNKHCRCICINRDSNRSDLSKLNVRCHLPMYLRIGSNRKYDAYGETGGVML